MSDDACMVSIEVDGRQRYLFETDKWQEMLGASRIIQQTRDEARARFTEQDGLHLVQPVSGEIRAWALLDRRRLLLEKAWELRDWLSKRGVEHTCGYVETSRHHFEKSDEPPMNATTPPSVDDRTSKRADLAAIQKRMSRHVGARKAAKIGGDARPVCSLFAPCRLHGFDFANEWRVRPEQGEPDEPRRRQRGFRAQIKQQTWRDARKRLYEDEIKVPLGKALEAAGVPNLAVVLADLEKRFDYSQHLDEAEQRQQDRYIAFLCADGDGFGSLLLPALDWNTSAWGDNLPAWRRNAEFVEALDACVRASFRQALIDVTVGAVRKESAKDESKRERASIPVLLQLVGGDDLWTLARRDVALDLACRFSQAFETGAEGDEWLAKAVRVANINGPVIEKLTISVGVAFAKSGYPVHAMADAAETLLAEAKALRKGDLWGRSEEPRGCLDWHWIQSSVSEPVEDARAHGWMYAAHEEGIATLLLTTRPWSITQAGPFIKAKQAFDGLARRKRQQLEDILRRGYTLSLLAWEAWWKSLTSDERDHLRDARLFLAEGGCVLPAGGVDWDVEFLPWERVDVAHTPAVYRTPWLDLLALDDMLRVDDAERQVNAGPLEPHTAGA